MANFNICCGDVNLIVLFGTLDCKWNVKWMQWLGNNDLDQCFAASKMNWHQPGAAVLKMLNDQLQL